MLLMCRSLFLSATMNLCDLLALRDDLKHLKKVLYFHENQLVYPVRKQQDRDFQFGYNQILSWLVLRFTACAHNVVEEYIYIYVYSIVSWFTHASFRTAESCMPCNIDWNLREPRCCSNTLIDCCLQCVNRTINPEMTVQAINASCEQDC